MWDEKYEKFKGEDTNIDYQLSNICNNYKRLYVLYNYERTS